MPTNPAYQYQIYQTYLTQAREAETSGALESAQKLYRHAAQSLLVVAKSNDGEIQASQLKNVELLINKANSLTQGGSAGSQSAQGPFQAEAVPDVGFCDIAGLEDVKREVRERVLQPILKPEVYQAFGIKPGGGILMFGLPGTGKTMIARAIAKEVQAPFFYINTSDIKDKYVGSSERNIAALFDQVRKEKAAVIFMDEFDGLGGKAGDDSNSTSRSILAELKSQMDGFDKDAKTVLLLLAATNKPWDIDTSFLRSGRFSKMLYVPLPDEEARRFLVTRHLSKHPLEADMDLHSLVQKTEGYNAADVVEVCTQAKLRAASRSVKVDQISKISQEDIQTALKQFRSTVVVSDLHAMHAFMKENGFHIPQRM